MGRGRKGIIIQGTKKDISHCGPLKKKKEFIQ